MLLHDEVAVNQALRAGDQLVELLTQKGQLAGSYDLDWNGDYSFICITGHAQLILFFTRLYRFIGNKAFQTAAMKTFSAIQDIPAKSADKAIRGGIAGSIPFNKGYQPYRYLNWAAKFYLDASLQLYQIDVANKEK